MKYVSACDFFSCSFNALSINLLHSFLASKNAILEPVYCVESTFYVLYKHALPVLKFNFAADIPVIPKMTQSKHDRKGQLLYLNTDPSLFLPAGNFIPYKG